MFQETISSIFWPKNPHKEEKAFKIRRRNADRRLRSSDVHVPRTDMVSRWTQTKCQKLSEKGDMRVSLHPTGGGYDHPDNPIPVQIERTGRISRASPSETGRHTGVASPYWWRL